MNTKICNESLKLYESIKEVSDKQNELKIEVAQIATDISWMKTGISDIQTKLNNCAACKNPEQIFSSLSEQKKTIQNIKNDQYLIKYTAIGLSAGISIIITIILFILKVNTASP